MKKNLLPPADLKSWLHRDNLSKTDKLLLILAALDGPQQVRDIRIAGTYAGLKAVGAWNISSLLAAAHGKAINTPSGWELVPAGIQYLRSLGVGNVNPAAVQVASDLRALLQTIEDAETKTFLEEAIQCHEFDLYRSAVVMSWLAAVHMLKLEVHKNHLADFNREAVAKDPNWKKAKTTDDLGMMKEATFLDRLVDISLLGKNVKEQLKECLNRRNACGHPNSMKIGPNTVASHIEVLLLNVFQRFC